MPDLKLNGQTDHAGVGWPAHTGTLFPRGKSEHVQTNEANDWAAEESRFEGRLVHCANSAIRALPPAALKFRPA